MSAGPLFPHGTSPDGELNEASLGKDHQFFKEQDLLQGNVSVEQVVDNSFVEAAIKDLGPYVRRSE